MDKLLLGYFIIGFIFSVWFWRDTYEDKYEESPNKCENGMVNLFLLVVILIWPVMLWIKYWKKH